MLIGVARTSLQPMKIDFNDKWFMKKIVLLVGGLKRDNFYPLLFHPSQLLDQDPKVDPKLQITRKCVGRFDPDDLVSLSVHDFTHYLFLQSERIK